ncbi:MAG: hypothetical protein KatS3mg015_2654 [Fimbriimonadales bacterium]|nr:MAG: hypothetical protein KatS3mg015_2654 [Fimbriimonadales bacterium]
MDYQSTHNHDCWDWGPKHYECAMRKVKELQAEVERLRHERDEMRDQGANLAQLQTEIKALREALKELLFWVPSADTYRRMGLDHKAPMQAYGVAKALLAKENSND